MQTKYVLVNGEEISHVFMNDNTVTFEDMEHLATLYFDKCKVVPTAVWMDMSLYKTWMHTLYGAAKLQYVPAGQHTYPQMQSSVGPLIIYARWMSNKECPLLVGNDIDLERNDADQAFEDIVLKDCECE